MSLIPLLYGIEIGRGRKIRVSFVRFEQILMFGFGKFLVNNYNLVFIEFRYTGSKSKMQYQMKKVSTVSGRCGDAHEFQPVSTFSPQENLGAVEKRKTCIIYIEGPPQLASLQVKGPNSATSTLDLSHVL